MVDMSTKGRRLVVLRQMAYRLAAIAADARVGGVAAVRGVALPALGIAMRTLQVPALIGWLSAGWRTGSRLLRLFGGCRHTRLAQTAVGAAVWGIARLHAAATHVRVASLPVVETVHRSWDCCVQGPGR